MTNSHGTPQSYGSHRNESVGATTGLEDVLPIPPPNDLQSARSKLLPWLRKKTAQPNNTKSPPTTNTDDDDDDGDPYDLYGRFVEKQHLCFVSALVEIRQGQKRGCWLWFVFPTGPYMVKGVERGSSMNRAFALRGDDCVKAYLTFEDKPLNIHLRTNYLLVVAALLTQLQGGNTLLNIFGPMDDVKVISSLTLFGRIATEMNDVELAGVCASVLELASKVKKRPKGIRVFDLV